MRKFGIAGFVSRLPIRFTVCTTLVIATAILISPTSAFANGSPARLAAGGIELVKSEHVRMLEEVLEISTKQVKVKYRFLNESDKDIHTTVAFPFPKYQPISPDQYRATSIRPTLKVLVNGKTVAEELVRKAVADGRDVTDRLRKQGLSEKEIFYDVDTGDERTRDALEKKLSRIMHRMNFQQQQQYTIEETAFWKMFFPAGKEIIVELEYAPALGWGSENYYRTRLKSEACLDDSILAAMQNQAKADLNPARANVTVQDVEYILGTGRNWKGPIGEFTLRVKKEKPDEFVSLCFPGKPTRVSPTVYEYHEKDFVPPDKLVVYFYSVEPEVSQ